MRARRLALVLAAALAAACEEPVEPGYFPVEVRTSEAGEPLAGAQVFVDGAPIGASDATGLVRNVLRGEDGTRVEVRAACPEGRTASPPSVVLTLREVAAVQPGDAPVALRIAIECVRSQLDTVIVVDAAGAAGAPVQIDGATVTRTDALGIAHVVLSGRPDEQHVVRLDTSGHPELRPRDPSTSFTIGDRDDVVVFAPALAALAHEPARRPRRRRHTQAVRLIPQRLR